MPYILMSQVPDFMAQFEEILEDEVAVYDLCLAKAKDRFKDERAQQAYAFTMFKQTMDKCQRNPVKFEPPFPVFEDI